MPCSGISVATAKIANELSQYLSLMTPETISQAIQAYLQNQFSLTITNSRIYGDNIIIVTGQQTIEVNYKTGRIQVQGRLSANKAFMDQIKTSLVDLLTGLAGYTLQQGLIGKIKSQVTVTGQQTAPNGAVILEVEI